MRAEGTHITPRQNNPLKFSPGAKEALTRMLQPEATPGFLDPIAALQDAHHDLLVHQVAMVAGMRAAVFELFSRLGPEAAENEEGPAHGLSRLSLLRAAALWQRHRMQHARLLEHLDDDFETIFGREFLRAYEAQSRVTPAPIPDPGFEPDLDSGFGSDLNRDTGGAEIRLDLGADPGTDRKLDVGPDLNLNSNPDADPASPEEPWPMFAR